MEAGPMRGRVLAPPLVIAAIALLVLLAFNLRNLDAGPEQLPPPIAGEKSPDPGGGEGSGDALRTLFLAFLVVVTLLIVIGIVVTILKGEKLRSLLSIWDVLGYLMGLVFVVLGVLYGPRLAATLDTFIHGITGGGSNPATPGPPGTGTSLTAGSGGAFALVLAVGIVGTGVLILASLLLSQLYGIATDASPEAARRRRALAQTVRRAIADLEAGEDFRAAVLRCYRSMLLLFEGHGLKADPSSTAREFESDALGAVGVSPEGIDDLTSLFEEARYSTHPIGAGQRDAAIACLSSIRAQLEAGP